MTLVTVQPPHFIWPLANRVCTECVGLSLIKFLLTCLEVGQRVSIRQFGCVINNSVRVRGNESPRPYHVKIPSRLILSIDRILLQAYIYTYHVRTSSSLIVLQAHIYMIIYMIY